MRIGLVIETFDPARGGAEHWTWQFALQLLSAGHEVHVAARTFAQATPEAIHKHSLQQFRGRLAFAEAAEQVLRPLGLDVVHDMGASWCGNVFQPHGGSRTATFEQSLMMLPAWLRPLKRHTAPLFSRHRQFKLLLQRQYEDRGQLIIALSRMVMRDMMLHHDVPRQRMRLVYNGVDVHRFSPDHREKFRGPARARLNLKPDTTLLFIAAHNFRLKGVPTLIRSVARLLDQGHRVHLAVAGGKRLGHYRRMADRLDAGSAISLLGPIRDVIPLYAAADVYVQPTFYDPCSLVVLEALASGLPVVTTPLNGASELLTPGVHGSLLHDPSDDATLAELLVPLLDTDRRQKMGQAGRQLALEHSLAHNCQQILSVYGELVRRKGVAA